ncbi:unnamed protein product [Chironomus riparius]|uniref:Uncharacterized protein n=1 Tax=Chironomus riparius TaxID=315576 RepID=A0A9N9WT68_9DIPT|nr:unnamed protein product [Chironomus riparius]
MPIDSAWIFRICLVTTVILILFADTLGYGGANARKNDQKNENNEKYSDDKDQDLLDDLKESQDKIDSEDKIDVKFLKKAFNEKQRLERKKAFEIVQQRLTESLRDLCLPKLLCEIAAKPIYLLSDKEKHVLSLLKTTSLSIVADKPSVWHFSSHMGQLLRHSADTMGAPIGCAMLWPNCPYSSDKLMKISAKVRLR